MSNAGSNKDFDDAVEAALIEAELFLKYRVPQRAVERLRRAIEAYPRAINLRERLRDVAANNKQPEEAARQCLALASLYIAREDFDDAHDRLLDAKQLDPRISIASGSKRSAAPAALILSRTKATRHRRPARSRSPEI